MKHILAVLFSAVILASVAGAATPAHKLSRKEVRELVMKADTPDDHHRLASYYQSKAEEMDGEAKEHAEMAELYRANPNASETKRPGSVGTARHCVNLSQNLSKAASEYRALAESHEEMASK